MDRKRLAIILFGVAALIVVGVIGLVIAQAMFPNKPTVVVTPTAVAKPTQAATPTAATSTVSPLIFGTNIGLFDEHDQVVTSQNVQDMMKKMHVQIMRMPTRSNLTDALNTQAAQAIKNVGAVPLVALRGAQSPNVPQVTADDTRMINVMNQVFPDSTVYYEFGNEDDLNGVKIDSSNPAVPGKYVTVYLTGLGAVTPPVAEGAVDTVLSNVNSPVAVTVGGVPVADLEFKGLSPTLKSVYVMNIKIPFGLARGLQSLAVQTVEGFTDMVSIFVSGPN